MDTNRLKNIKKRSCANCLNRSKNGNYHPGVGSSGSRNFGGGGPRNMKYKAPRTAAIFFWPIFLQAGGGGHGLLGPPPWIRYWWVSQKCYSVPQEEKKVIYIIFGNFPLIASSSQQFRCREIEWQRFIWDALFKCKLTGCWEVFRKKYHN